MTSINEVSQAQNTHSRLCRYCAPMRFAPYLATAVKKAGYTQRAFAKKVRHHQQNFNQIIRGKRAPPLKHLPAWIALLGEHVDPALFRELAELEHTPPGIQKLVVDLRQKLKAANR